MAIHLHSLTLVSQGDPVDVGILLKLLPDGSRVLRGISDSDFLGI